MEGGKSIGWLFQIPRNNREERWAIMNLAPFKKEKAEQSRTRILKKSERKFCFSLIKKQNCPILCWAKKQRERIAMSLFYGNGVALTEKTLDLLWGRQNLTVNNIANVDTPNYKSKYLTFENELLHRISTAEQGGRKKIAIGNAIQSQRARIHSTKNESSRLDGNNVDMDQEQVELVKTTYAYQYMVNSVNNDLRRLMAAAKSF